MGMVGLIMMMVVMMIMGLVSVRYGWPGAVYALTHCLTLLSLHSPLSLLILTHSLTHSLVNTVFTLHWWNTLTHRLTLSHTSGNLWKNPPAESIHNESNSPYNWYIITHSYTQSFTCSLTGPAIQNIALQWPASTKYMIGQGQWRPASASQASDFTNVHRLYCLTVYYFNPLQQL